jgi:hypothetical protein
LKRKEERRRGKRGNSDPKRSLGLRAKDTKDPNGHIILPRGGRVFDSEGIKIEGGREKKEEEEEERRNIYHSSL